MKGLLWAALAVLLCVSTAQATTITTTSEDSFKAATTPTYYLNDFSNYTGWAPLSGPQTFSGGGFKYTASAWDDPEGLQPGQAASLWKVPVGGNEALSTANSLDHILFDFQTPVQAVGGYFFGTDYNGNFAATKMKVTLLGGASYEYTAPNATSFVGFLSDDSILQLDVYAPTASWTGAPASDPGPYPTVDHFYVGTLNGKLDTGPQTPEPASMALFGLGLAVAGLGRRRAKKA